MKFEGYEPQQPGTIRRLRWEKTREEILKQLERDYPEAAGQVLRTTNQNGTANPWGSVNDDRTEYSDTSVE